MPNYKDGQNKPLLDLSEPIAKYLDEKLIEVQAISRLLNKNYMEERKLEMEGREDAKSHAGLMLGSWPRSQSTHPFPTMTIDWRRGSPHHNKPEAMKARTEKTGKVRPITRHIHHCGKDGGYLKKNINAVVKNDWEVEMTMAYERAVVPLRKYISQINDIFSALARLPDIPEVDVENFPPRVPKRKRRK